MKYSPSIPLWRTNEELLPGNALSRVVLSSLGTRWNAPNFLSLRQTFTRSLARVPGRLNKKKAKDLTLCLTCSYHYVITITHNCISLRRALMKCQSFPCVAAVFAPTLTWGLISSHAADEAFLDTATIEAITGRELISHKTIMRWITRERPKIDRVACPWLISRFI